MTHLHVVGFALLTGVLVQVDAQCQDGFQHLQNRCYKAMGLEASWIEARAYCKLLGSELAIIETAGEELTIEGLLAGLHGTHIDEEYWLSGTDIATEKNWQWMTVDGSSMPITTYTNWAHGQPDDSGHRQDCLLLHYRSGRTSWVDEQCEALHSFICENGDGVIPAVVVG